MSKVVVLCPSGAATGGVELSHQLVDSLSNANCSAATCYYPFNRSSQVPEEYRQYRCAAVQYRDVDFDNDVIILPEIYTYLSNRFKKARVYIWWMSVDNYVNSAKWKFAFRNMFPPWRYQEIGSPNFRKRFEGHFYQSEYARQFLAIHGIQKVQPLGDYVNDAYVSGGRRVDLSEKQDIVVFNPTKGITSTRRILSLLKDVHAVPIAGMSRSQLIGLLARAKVYIDFGHHPGKDRIPREAAIMGCCVVTNMKGSASNPFDIPIDDKYKIDDQRTGFETAAADMVREILENYAGHTRSFDYYRSIIAAERTVFDAQVSSLKRLLGCES